MRKFEAGFQRAGPDLVRDGPGALPTGWYDQAFGLPEEPGGIDGAPEVTQDLGSVWQPVGARTFLSAATPEHYGALEEWKATFNWMLLRKGMSARRPRPPPSLTDNCLLVSPF